MLKPHRKARSAEAAAADIFAQAVEGAQGAA